MDEKDAFRVYDSDGSGGISAEELSRISEGMYIDVFTFPKVHIIYIFNMYNDVYLHFWQNNQFVSCVGLF